MRHQFELGSSRENWTDLFTCVCWLLWNMSFSLNLFILPIFYCSILLLNITFDGIFFPLNEPKLQNKPIFFWLPWKLILQNGIEKFDVCKKLPEQIWRLNCLPDFLYKNTLNYIRFVSSNIMLIQIEHDPKEIKIIRNRFRLRWRCFAFIQCMDQW